MASPNKGRMPQNYGLDQRVQECDSKEGAKKSESYLIDLIDKADTLRAHHDLIDKLNHGTLDTPGFIRALAPQAALEVLYIMKTTDNVKVKLEAAKDILDRAGHVKTQKIAHLGMNIDHQTSKRELINMILSSAKKAGVSAIRKDMEDETIIDVKPTSSSGVQNTAKPPAGTGDKQVSKQDGKTPPNDSDK